MATRFESLKLEHPDLFGVRICGTVGRGDKDRLHELADKCLDRGKVHLILDLEELSSIGGGGARALAEFQERVVEAGGETVFVGVGEVVQRFLDQKFEDVPLRTFPDLDAAVADHAARCAPESTPEEIAVETVAPENSGLELDGVLKDVPTNQMATGRRKDHHYTSLSDAVASLGRWTDHDDHAEFAKALGNLLFSHGLAEETILLTRQGDEMVDPGGERRLPAASGLVKAVERTDRPLTLLDVHEEDLDEDDAIIIETFNPDMILPVVVDESLAAMVLLRREGERDYSVAENFALELLMRVMTSGDDDTVPQPRDRDAEAAAAEDYQPANEDDDYQPTWEPDGTSPAEVLLQLALDLPEAVDRPHFWRIFARHTWPVLPVNQLGFLGPERGRPQIMVGGNDSWMGLELGGEKLQLFFNSMERPVAVENMPMFFKATRQEMREAGVDWVVALKWDGEILGTVLLELDPDFVCDDPTGLLEELFLETARLLSRYDGSNDNADVNLELVRILVSQREKRCFGADDNATAMVAHVNRLARVMAFPPDQERDLIYGCLLRDVGLFDKSDQIIAGGAAHDAQEQERYRRHPDEGVALLAGLNLPATIVDVVRSHHERFDGSGFPRGLKGRDIPLAARVVAVVEQYVGMVTGTGGRATLRPEAAAEVLREQSGTLFDPELVEIFLKAVLPTAARRRRSAGRPFPQPVA